MSQGPGKTATIAIAEALKTPVEDVMQIPDEIPRGRLMPSLLLQVPVQLTTQEILYHSRHQRPRQQVRGEHRHYYPQGQGGEQRLHSPGQEDDRYKHDADRQR